MDNVKFYIYLAVIGDSKVNSDYNIAYGHGFGVTVAYLRIKTMSMF